MAVKKAAKKKSPSKKIVVNALSFEATQKLMADAKTKIDRLQEPIVLAAPVPPPPPNPHVLTLQGQVVELITNRTQLQQRAGEIERNLLIAKAEHDALQQQLARFDGEINSRLAICDRIEGRGSESLYWHGQAPVVEFTPQPVPWQNAARGIPQTQPPSNYVPPPPFSMPDLRGISASPTTPAQPAYQDPSLGLDTGIRSESADDIRRGL